MQGISDTRHRQLIDALLNLEAELKGRGALHDVEKAVNHRKKLTEMKANYDYFVAELSKQIVTYFEEYDKAKVKFVGVKLRELKRQIAREAKMFNLHNDIRHNYGT